MRAYLGTLLAGAIALVCLGPPGGAGQPEDRTCATVVLQRGEALLVGHNLDEAIPVPGLVVVNPRRLAKENIPYGALKPFGGTGDAPLLRWVSRYGSLTYNFFGREFPDGGLNEAGLYVGEMTLMKTVWPEGGTQARLYHNQWMQYLLDNFATVEEALASLNGALPEGHCKWHFLLADKGGDAAVVEFLQGKPVVYRGATLPYPVLCNDPYQPEVDEIRMYAGFGGTKPPEARYDPEDPRFRWAAVMLQDTEQPADSDRAFAVLKRLDFGTTKWSIVYDLRAMRMWFKTSVSPKIKWVDLAAFDYHCTPAPMALDIHADIDGDVSKLFNPLTAEANRRAVQAAWKEIDAGFLGSIFFKPGMTRNIAKAAEGVGCESK